jgi:hypothetical protein
MVHTETLSCVQILIIICIHHPFSGYCWTGQFDGRRCHDSQDFGSNDDLRELLTAVWDAVGITSEGCSLFLEAKAHIPEAVSRQRKRLLHREH